MHSRKRSRRTSILAAICLMAVIGTGCGEPDKKNNNGKTYTAEDVGPRLVSAYNDFGFELFRKTTAVGPEAGNAVLSPVSVALALSMTINGAAGPTRNALAQGLHLQGIGAEETNVGARALQHVLQNADASVQLSVANSLWARKGVPFQKDFLTLNKEFYGARTEQLDFGKRSAADTINQWAKKQTNGRIDQMVNAPIDPQTMLFLLNAVYFKGDWTIPFDKEATRDRPFLLADGTKVDRSTMARRGSFDYAEQQGYAAVRLPYGNGSTGMIILLPDEGVKLSSLVERLTGTEWSALIGSLQKQEGEVSLPRFKLEYAATLNEPLKVMGMALAFDPLKADFSGMLTPPPNMYIGEVKHKTYVRVDEKGTEAAAVTKVEMRAGSAPNPSGFRMNIDRPFLFALQERQTGALLFVGTVYDPQF
ncbi:serpin family protein [Paenibacillus hodogayensis]|uniref:Serpin family protein n=1 Tax=Paenibacillus hodogayensis TaxID=279208 RepID=A0ABV5VT29_9BACL